MHSQGSHSPGKSLKILEKKAFLEKSWKMAKNLKNPWKSWKRNSIHENYGKVMKKIMVFELKLTLNCCVIMVLAMAVFQFANFKSLNHRLLINFLLYYLLLVHSS